MPAKSIMEFDWGITPIKFLEVTHKDIPASGHNHIVIKVEDHTIPINWKDIADIVTNHIKNMLKKIEDEISS